ncbi:MAG: ACT domain-containing protein [Elusimicrobiota bacterium]
MIKLVRQYSVFLPNAPGAMNRFLEYFFRSGINIIGIASEMRDDSGIVRITVDSENRISSVLTKEGFTTIETQMILLQLMDKPGMLLRMSALLGEHGINITTIYGTTYTGAVGHLLLNVTDVPRAMELLKELIESGPGNTATGN